MVIAQVILALLANCTNDRAAEFTGSTATISGVPYWIPPETLPTNDNSFTAKQLHEYTVAAGGLLPLTVVHGDFGNNSLENPLETLARYKNQDDVWQDGFSNVIYIPSAAGQKAGSAESSSLQDLGNRCILFGSDDDERIPEGPYFSSLLGLHRAYRLYSDYQTAFSESMYTNSQGIHSILPASLPGQSLAIAVPSRLYYKRTTDTPLAGVRLGVKDIYDISGVKTGNGNRAWYNFYPEANFTALAVKRLIDAGAVVVGKMKTGQFANGEYANSDWIDYQSPFNPRGDGYQNPSSSSTGSAVGLASYPWLDLALGSDSGGSIRGPALAQGLHALRPSHGLIALTHTTPLAPEFDTAALIVRDPALLRDGAAVLYAQDSRKTAREYPKQILAAELPTDLSTESSAAVNKFMNGLKNVLGVSNITEFNIDTTWGNSKPQPELGNLVNLMNTTYSTITSQRQTESVRDPFYVAYARKHDGRRPFINPVPLIRWSYGDSLPRTTSADAMKDKTLFMNWFQEHVLSTDTDTCSNSVLAYVPSPLVLYRNAYREPPTVGSGFPARHWSVMSETPDLVLTVGQTSYHSEITNHTEYLPVVIDLMVAKGCDSMLLDLAVDLVEAGIIQNIKTGASAIYGDEIIS